VIVRSRPAISGDDRILPRNPYPFLMATPTCRDPHAGRRRPPFPPSSLARKAGARVSSKAGSTRQFHRQRPTVTPDASSRSNTNRTDIEPSPMAVATRLIDLLLASPTQNTPGLLVSRSKGS